MSQKKVLQKNKSVDKSKKLDYNEPNKEQDKEKKIEQTEVSYEEINYMPFVSKLPSINENIFDGDPTPTFSTTIDYPRFTLGFQHFIHASKNKMEITKEFENKKKVYLIMNPFERYVDNYDQDIGHMSAIYYELVKKAVPDILSRGFYKLWELLLMFDIIDIKKKNFISAHLAEGPGSFIQATMFYRDKFCEKN